MSRSRFTDLRHLEAQQKNPPKQLHQPPSPLYFHLHSSLESIEGVPLKFRLFLIDKKRVTLRHFVNSRVTLAHFRGASV